MKNLFNLIFYISLVCQSMGFVSLPSSNKLIQLRGQESAMSSTLLTTQMLRNNNNDNSDSPDRRDMLSTAASFLPILALTSSLSSKAFAQDEVQEVVEQVNDGWTQHIGKFDEKNLKDYTTTSSGLLYKDIQEGTGKMPNDGDAVSIEMVGYIFETGDKWCNTYKGIPTYGSTVRAGVRENQKFMKGLNEGVKTMKKGGRRILVIPAYLAYSYTTIFSPKNKEDPLIPGGSALVCYIEMLDFKKLQ